MDEITFVLFSSQRLNFRLSMYIFKVCSLGNNSPHQPHSRTATACTHWCNQFALIGAIRALIARLTNAQSHHKLLLRQFHSLPDLLRSQSQSISANHDQENPHQYFESAHQNLVVWPSDWCRPFFHIHCDITRNVLCSPKSP